MHRSGYVPNAAGTAVTPTMRSLTVVPEPLLDAASTTAWYLFASPALRGGSLVYGSLEGNTGPRVTVDAPFAVDGIQLKVIYDFYAAVADFRFTYKAIGA